MNRYRESARFLIAPSVVFNLELSNGMFAAVRLCVPRSLFLSKSAAERRAALQPSRHFLPVCAERRSARVFRIGSDEKRPSADARYQPPATGTAATPCRLRMLGRSSIRLIHASMLLRLLPST